MAKINRKTQKIYGSSAGATGITEFGSPAGGTPAYSTDLDAIQTTEWLTGWAAAALAGSEIPTFQDFNAIHFVFANQIAYTLQEGIPEFDIATEYHQNSIVKKTGTYELYGSLVNTNTGNALPSRATDAFWQYLGAIGESQTFIFDDTGLANDYDLNIAGGLGNPAQYFDGLTVLFKASNASSAASVLSIGALADKSLTLPDGSAISTEIVSGEYVEAVYRSFPDRFEITNVTAAGAQTFDSGAQTITAGGALVLAHGLTASPDFIQPYLQNVNADDGYSPGEILFFNSTGSGNVLNRGLSVVPDATNLNIRFGSATEPFEIIDKATGVFRTITPANWDFGIRAFKL